MSEQGYESLIARVKAAEAQSAIRAERIIRFERTLTPIAGALDSAYRPFHLEEAVVARVQQMEAQLATARALTMEEAALVAVRLGKKWQSEEEPKCSWSARQIADELRTLAPLPSGLVAVEKCNVCGSVDAIRTELQDFCSKGHGSEVRHVAE